MNVKKCCDGAERRTEDSKGSYLTGLHLSARSW
jgi:hypothetical protein